MCFEGLIGFADILITSTMIKTQFQTLLQRFFFEGSVAFIRMWQGSVTRKCLRNAALY